VDVVELRALDVPVVFLDLVVENVRVREVGVQCVDDLFGLVGIDTKCLGAFDITVLLADGFLGAHNNCLLERKPLKLLV